MQVAENPTAYMIDGPGYAGQSMFNSLIFNSSPQRTSSYACGPLLWINGRIVEIAREIDYEAVFDRRGTTQAMAAATDRNLEAVRPSVLQRERNVVSVLYEGDNTSFALQVGGPASYGLSVFVVVRGHDIPFEGLLELGETRHPRQELMGADWQQSDLVIPYTVYTVGIYNIIQFSRLFCEI
jgi:hypothetical protein